MYNINMHLNNTPEFVNEMIQPYIKSQESLSYITFEIDGVNYNSEHLVEIIDIMSIYQMSYDLRLRISDVNNNKIYYVFEFDCDYVSLISETLKLEITDTMVNEHKIYFRLIDLEDSCNAEFIYHFLLNFESNDLLYDEDDSRFDDYYCAYVN